MQSSTRNGYAKSRSSARRGSSNSVIIVPIGLCCMTCIRILWSSACRLSTINYAERSISPFWPVQMKLLEQLGNQTNSFARVRVCVFIGRSHHTTIRSYTDLLIASWSALIRTQCQNDKSASPSCPSRTTSISIDLQWRTSISLGYAFQSRVLCDRMAIPIRYRCSQTQQTSNIKHRLKHHHNEQHWQGYFDYWSQQWYG